MTIIFSEKWDAVTNKVIDWLHFYNKEVIRLNIDEICNEDLIKIEVNSRGYSLILNVDGRVIDLNKIDSYWYRRGGINLKNYQFTCRELIPENLNLNVVHNLQQEKAELYYLIHYYLENKIKCKIGSYFQSSLIKLQVLHKASLCGLKIPQSYIINKKAELVKELKDKKIITKAIRENLDIADKKNGFYFLTTEISSHDLESIPSSFFPSLIQEKIEKKFEIRTTYFKEQFYSMAIHSQNDEQTKLDYRNYNLENPNRFIPYRLPEVIERKIHRLFKMLNLDFGSIDIIKTIDDEYVFLEINPVGQFGMVSWPMNYNIEKKIAHYLAYGRI